MQNDNLFAQHSPDNKHRFDQHREVREVLDKFPDAGLELHCPDHSNLEAEVTQSAAQVVIDGNRLTAAACDVNSMRSFWLRNASHAPDGKSRPHHLRDAAGIVAVGLVDLGLQYRPHVPRLDTDHRQARFGECAEKPS